MFSNVIFSDECQFELNRNTKKIFVLKGEQPQQKIKFNPNYTVAIWGAVSRRGKIAIEFYDKNLNAEKYLNILKKHIPKNS